VAEAVVLTFGLLLTLGTGLLKYKLQVGLHTGQLELDDLIKRKRIAHQELQVLCGALSQVDLKERHTARECRCLNSELKKIRTRLSELDQASACQLGLADGIGESPGQELTR
jgi:uncharacterized protein (DUF3084 family)